MRLLTKLVKTFLGATKSPAEIAELSIELIIAAGNNDVAKIKKLIGAGADINFNADITLGSGTVRIDADELLSQPTGNTSALMVALHNGAFDAALYLAESGADATSGRKDSSGFFTNEDKPLDFLVTDHVPERTQETPETVTDFLKDAFDDKARARRQKNYQTDLYTPKQRVRLFDALVTAQKAKGRSPLELVSERTLQNVIEWGRAEMIPKLAGIGVKIEDEHFVRAANPIHRKNQSIAMMEAILPYVRDVNVTDGLKNAGHEAASNFDLEAFKWLEKRGLDRNAVADLNVPTYAHLVAGSIRHEEGDDRIAFARYLADQKYNLSHKGDSRLGFKSPTDVAFSEGNIDIGLMYLNSGVIAKSEYLAHAIEARHFNKVTTEALLNLVEVFLKKGILDQETAKAAYAEMVEKISWNDKNIPLYGPVAIALTAKGFAFETDRFHGEKAVAAKKLQDEMGRVRQATLSIVPELPKLDKKPG